ncbi:glycosyltransferase family 8 protein [Paenibacillus tianjinensis]|uniref:Glycosyltransferase family 8 protein n=1 Tax=Paenibacillus tianjinensis TaxID=2810347 RepID=A0ABX7L6B4_9BACL|nr:glycosyltransferase family 8 protein [Paenibacillus tianjinensis]QSF43539.1 glycosyltransferase family 8 protein [Paenibacillus tianjinensis]
MTMNIAIIYSPNWAEWAAVETYSIFKTNEGNIKVYLISDKDGIFDASYITDPFGNRCKIEFINAEDKFKELIPSTVNVSSRFTKYALYRLMLPELVKDDKLLHIDADALVVGDVTDLYNTNIDDYYIAGAVDIHADHYNLKKPLGLTDKDVYVNAGVLLMNLRKIREDKIYDKWLYEVNTKKYMCHDQCILNKTCKKKIKLIDNKYNVSISTGLNLERENINIIHYAGNDKPWDKNSVPHPHFWFRTLKDYRKAFEVSKK